MNDSRAINEGMYQQTQQNPASNSSMIISEKQMGNKSVLIVKPNQFGGITANDSTGANQNRSSKRKIYDN
jgi:hypothetical protein